MSDLGPWQTLFHQPKKSLLCLHTKPDGDSIGSNLALAQLLKDCGHDITIIARDKPDAKFSFLAGFDQIKVVDMTTFNWSEFAILWAIDISATGMIAENLILPNSLKTVVIDHHASNTGWAETNYIQPDAASATQVLLGLAQQLELSINSSTAQCLYTGLATDTSFFEFSNTVEVFACAGELISLGADPAVIFYQILQQATTATLKVAADILKTVKLYQNPSMAIFTLSQQLMQQHQLVSAPGLVVDYASKMANTDFGVVMTEEVSGIWRLEIRSHSLGYDVLAIARKLGGGGHISAAGVRQIAGTQTEVLEKISNAANY
jgi:phosphoesterase RecJ-like protein